MQVASMERNRELLRRGSKKMQDGTLGTPIGNVEDDPVYITIGDQIIHQTLPPQEPQEPPQPPTVEVPDIAMDWMKKALLSTALVLGGVGVGAAVPWLLGAFDKPTTTFTDTNTRYELTLDPVSLTPGGE